MRTLVIYDISSNEIRAKLANLLFDYGLQRIQFSAFEGKLDTYDREVLAKELQGYIGSERDSIYVIPLCGRCARLYGIISGKPTSLLKGGVKIV